MKEMHDPLESDLLKLRVPLPPATWYSYSAETLWVLPVERHQYLVKNVPFYAKGLSFDDSVTASGSADGILDFTGIAGRGGHSTYRLFLREELGPRDLDSLGFWRPLQRYGCTYEQATKRLFAIDVPPEADIYAVYDLLEKGEGGGAWDFQEGHCGHQLRE